MLLNKKNNIPNNGCYLINIQFDSETFKFLNNSFIDNNILTLSSCDSFVDNGGDIQIQIGRKNLELEINEQNFKLKQIKLNPSLITIINNKKENIVYE